MQGWPRLAWSRVIRIGGVLQVKVAHALQIGNPGFWPRPAEVVHRTTRRQSIKDPEVTSSPRWSQPPRGSDGIRLSPCRGRPVFVYSSDDTVRSENEVGKWIE